MGFENKWSLCSRELKGYRKQRSILKEHTQNLNCLSPCTETVVWKALGSDPLPDLEEPLRETGGNWTPPGYGDTGSSHFWNLVLPHWHLHWQVPLWNPSSSLLTPGACPIHQWASSSRASPGYTARCLGSHPCSPAGLQQPHEAEPHNQPGQGLAPHTTSPTISSTKKSMQSM